MPVTLPSLTRRQWLQGSLTAMLAPRAWGQQKPQDAETWVLFSDTHIAADASKEARGTVMAENLTRCVNQVLKNREKPFGVMVNGDCAFLDGQQGDYDTFGNLVRPLREAGIAVHCTLGNHDDREHFVEAFTNEQDPKPLPGRHVSVISSARVNWVLLDSLDQVNVTPGMLGEAQLGWLDRTLAKLPSKPTFVLAHHNLEGTLAEGQKHSGLVDSEAMLKVLEKHSAKVRAFIYGHTHNWSHSVDKATGIHRVNLPPVAYVFNAERPNGWVAARAFDDRLELELRALNPAHEQHKQIVSIAFEA